MKIKNRHQLQSFFDKYDYHPQERYLKDIQSIISLTDREAKPTPLSRADSAITTLENINMLVNLDKSPSCVIEPIEGYLHFTLSY